MPMLAGNTIAYRLWQGWTGKWFWQFADSQGALTLDRGVGGEAMSKQNANSDMRNAARRLFPDKSLHFRNVST